MSDVNPRLQAAFHELAGALRITAEQLERLKQELLDLEMLRGSQRADAAALAAEAAISAARRA